MLFMRSTYIFNNSSRLTFTHYAVWRCMR